MKLKLYSTVAFSSLLLSSQAKTLRARISRCPDSCDSSVPRDWTAYHDPAYIAVCEEALLLDLAIYNPLDDPETHKTIFACSTNGSSLAWEASSETSARASAKTGANFDHVMTTLELGWWGSADGSAIDSTLALTDKIQKYLSSAANSGRDDIFAHAGRVVNTKAVDALVQNFASNVNDNPGVFNQTTLGISVDTQGDLAAVQKHMRLWSDGDCVQGFDSSKEVNNHHGVSHSHPLRTRATCSYVQVVSGDSCASLVEECGITAAEFTEYNSASDLCSTLAVGQYVCCSKGTLPDLSPKPYDNGTCYSYTVQAGDSCSALASANSITLDDLEDFNTYTWGWMGCDDLQAGQTICLSDGDSPFPAPIANAVCGPQVPGTQQPEGDTSAFLWTSLNPCPLNACCDIWGQCGITPEYCTVSESPTGAPGTAAAGSNGCIDSCGTAITNDADGPDEFMAVGYYEAYGADRDCLNMPASDIDTSKYTHVHYAFGNISSDYEISVTDRWNTWTDFRNLTDVKKVMSFGGWGFSTNTATYSIFRTGVEAANRETFAKNIVDFVNEYDLDGVDFDWEYPGEPDIPGIPAGSDDDGDNYLEFLKLVRNSLPSSKTLSIAAPASYWYLQAFPIANISTVVDYIIYMTYDLHGQWDYGNAYAQDGCPSGNCLRSHVNLTETMYSLAMLTKAGAATKQIVVGVTSYGRSFEMTDASCTGPMCTFTGPESGATPGMCTDTAGYIANAEIDLLIDSDNSTQVLFDGATDSDIIIYDSTQWVAYMTNTTKSTRTTYYQSLNMAGTSEWAIDLETADEEDDESEDWDACDTTYSSLDAISADSGNIPDYCMNTYIVGAQQTTLDKALENYTSIVDDGYDAKFKVYNRYISELIPEELKSYMAANASRYFTCTREKNIVCCDDCPSAACGTCTPGSDCVPGYANVTIACPSSIPDATYDVYESDVFSVTYECTDTDAFYKEIESLFGIVSSWTKLGKLLVKIDAGCEGSSTPCDDENMYYTGFPMLADDFEVPNPKDLISKSLTNLTIINEMLADAHENLFLNLWTANESAAVDSSILPASMTRFAVQEMAKVSAEASEIEAAEKNEIILNFVFGVIFLLPSIGAAIDSAELATLGRIITLTGDIGNLGVSIYGAVEDPASAVFAAFSLLVTRVDKPEEAMEEVKTKMEKVSADDIAKLGTVVKNDVNTVDSLKIPCI
ncbi:hypothetical protein BDW74DRAFT_185906 [Aspergillus multicolor]|uniref:uncharacterized protein n=1 Tax=Aspergillus multicolor TaxID=41759 RepID=UPI003CCD9460